MTGSSDATGSIEASKAGALLKAGTWILCGSIAFSLAGTLLLKIRPDLMSFFGPYYATLVKTPTWIYMALMPVLPFLLYRRQLGWAASWKYFFAGAIIGFGAEMLGTTTGMPFGGYGYTEWLGPKIAGHVPWFIPPSWYAMAILSYDLARKVRLGALGAILLTCVYMVMWDVALDPAMSRAFPFWYYSEPGFFFGMPFQNWVGWFITTLVIAIVYEFMFQPKPDASFNWVAGLWLVNGLFPLFVSLLYGLEVAVLFAIPALALPFVIHWVRNRRQAPTLAT